MLQNVRTKIGRQQGLAKADAIMQNVTARHKIGGLSHEEMVKLLNEAIACYHQHDFIIEAQQAASALHYLQGDSYYEAMMKVLPTNDKAADLLMKARDSYLQVHNRGEGLSNKLVILENTNM